MFAGVGSQVALVLLLALLLFAVAKFPLQGLM